MADARAQEVEKFLRSNLMDNPGAPLDLDTSLADSGILDSMGSVLLAAFIEEHFAIPVAEADIAAGRVNSIRHILALLDERSSEGRR